MKTIKRITAAVIAAATILSLTACGENTTTIAVANGKEIPSGVYLMSAITAYSSVSRAKTDAEKSVWDVMMGEKTAEQYVRDEADNSVKEYAAIEAEFEKLGLTIDEVAADNMNAQVESVFSDKDSADSFAKIGIGEVSYRALLENSYKSQEVFKAYYGVDGIEGLSDSEYKAYIKNKYLRAKYISVSLKDDEGNLLKGADKQAKYDYADELLEKATAENFDELEVENYNKIQGEKAEAKGEEYTPREYNPEEFANYASEALFSEETGMSDGFMKTVKDMPKNTVKVIEDGDKLYVLLKLDVLEREDFFTDDGKLQQLYEMKGEDYEALIDKLAAENTDFVWNDAAYERYAPKKIKMS